MPDFSRPASGERFRFDGLKVNSAPDSTPAHKYLIANNVRGYGEDSTQSRNQLVQNVAVPPSGSAPVTALEPSIGITKQGSILTSFVTAASIDTGYDTSRGASILPFRPNFTPNAWDYVFDDNKLTKVNITSSPQVITIQNIGIAEPQVAPEASPDDLNVAGFDNYGSWVGAGGGFIGPISQPIGRTIEALNGAIKDPASASPPGLAPSYTLIPAGGQEYSVGQLISTSFGALAIVQEVYPAMNKAAIVVIQAISYVSGTTGACVIVPSIIPAAGSAPGVNQPAASIFDEVFIATLRRGAVVNLHTPGGGPDEFIFILSVSKGPDGTISFETSTVNQRFANDVITGQVGLRCSFGNALPASFLGATISSNQADTSIGNGITTVTVTPLASNPFTVVPAIGTGTPTAREDDYIHLSLFSSDYSKITEIKILFDVNTSVNNFTQNFYYYTIRPNDLISGIQNTTTQLGVAQIVAQRTIIDEQTAQQARNQGVTTSSAQTVPGNIEWSEIRFKVRELTPVISDKSRSLANCNGIQILFNATATITVGWSSLWVQNGQDMDVGDSFAPVFYRVRPRSQLTGVKGNPSPETRYGVSPRRQQVVVTLPSAAYDSQIDTWDIERQGGSLEEYRYVGSVPSTAMTYVDKLFDLAIANSDTPGFDNLQPFPSVGPPITALSATIVGTRMTATFQQASQNAAGAATLSQLGSLLPGNLFNIGAYVYTLRVRPTLVSTTATTQTYLFVLQENAGSQTNPLVMLQEPQLAAQTSSKVFGPDANGIFFALMVGTIRTTRSTGLRPGLVQWTNANNPDGASDSNTADLCPPTEPLINGCLAGPTPWVASSKRWWRGFFSQDSNGRPRFTWNETQVGMGLAAEFGICTDGSRVYFVGKSGIYAHSGGAAQSLTDADLYNLFPHEDVYPKTFTYAGQSVFPPEYNFAYSFRLCVVNNYLYFDYLDASQTQRTLVCDLRRIAWSVDVVTDGSFSQPTIHAGTGLPASNFLLDGSAAKNQQLFMGGNDGAVYIEQSSPVANAGENVACVLATHEDMVGDVRSKKKFGDVELDVLAAGGNITITPILFGTLFGTTTSITGNQSARPATPNVINLQGEQIVRSLGLLMSWTDRGANTTLYSWQPSYVNQPEDITNRNTDWDNCGTEMNKFIQGFEIEADSSNAVKTFKVKDADNLVFHDFTSPTGTNRIQANGQQIIVCSFNAPFLAHLVRMEPQDQVSWRMFRVRWIYQPTPEAALTWITQASNFGLPGYLHAKELLMCYSSTAAITLTTTVFDGLSPSAITMPSTGGVVQKILFPYTPNKGMLYTFSAVSTAPFQIYSDSCEILVKGWGTPEGYRRIQNLGGRFGDLATV